MQIDYGMTMMKVTNITKTRLSKQYSVQAPVVAVVFIFTAVYVYLYDKDFLKRDIHDIRRRCKTVIS